MTDSVGEPAARWPWITRRRLTVVAIIATGATGGITWHHRATQQQFLAQLEQALPMSVALSADAIGDWVSLRAAQARTLAAVASQAPPAQAAPDALRAMLPLFVEEGGFHDGQVEPALTSQAPSPLRVRVSSEREALALAEFRAPIVRHGQYTAAVVLRVALSESAFSHFNVAAPDDRTQRTALLVLDSSASPTLQLLAVSHPGGGTHAPATQSRPRGIAPDALAHATYGQWSALTEGHGLGIGLSGQRVVYAMTTVPGTNWLLLRERDVSELLGLIAPSVFITDVIFGLLTTLVLVVLTLRWRAEHQRRETAAVQLRATFVASVSHELRTPLTQVRMYAEMLRLELLSTPQERTRALSVIEKEAERLTLLIERALAFVRTGHAAPPPPQESVVVVSAVARALDAIAALAAERFVRLRYDIDATLAVRIARDDLHQVLLNLLDNAIKYGPVGQVVQLSAQAVEGLVHIAVRDHGPGVAIDERARIWRPFHRGHAAASWSTSGTGIGLVVVRDLVERAGGRAWVESPAPPRDGPGLGAVFVVALPPGD